MTDDKKPIEESDPNLNLSGDDSPLLEDFEGGAGNGSFGDLVRNNPLVKIGIVFGAFITIVLVVVLFGGDGRRMERSDINAPSDISDVPAAEGVSDKYREAVEESNTQAVEEAMRKGTSALPTPISPPVGRVPAGDALGDAEDPLERWRRLQEERQRRNRPPPKELPTGDPNAEAINSLAEAMRQQMESILQSKQLKGPEHLKITDERFLDPPEDEDGAGGGASGSGSQQEEIVNIIVPAGTVEYAQLLTEANSDTPGPILAQVVSGPLSGSRMLGTFAVENDEYLVLKFNTIVIDGIGHSIDALALDPETTTPGLVTDIDNRYFSRVILPAAASFIEGIGGAIAETGGTNISVSGENVTSSEEDLNTREEIAKGVEKAATKIGELLDERAQSIKPLVRVEAGTPMGILFVEPVTDETSMQN